MSYQKVQSNQHFSQLPHMDHRGVCDVYIHHVRNTYGSSESLTGMTPCEGVASPPSTPSRGCCG